MATNTKLLTEPRSRTRHIEMSEIPDTEKKWSLPGWKIEQKYSNKVLVGNWLEERKEFKRGSYSTKGSCYRIDYASFPVDNSSVMLRRSITKRMQGLPKQHLITHHGEPNSKYLVSLYDDHYLRRGNLSLPPTRTFNGHQLAWVPECSDYPTIEPPTNYGLKKEKEMQWKESSSKETRSVYSASYKNPPLSAFTINHCGVAPRILSSKLHHHNNINKSLQFRNQKHLQVPDYPVRETNHNTLTKSLSLHRKPISGVA
ncbi:cilia- and flagella-associated protein 107-like [Spea bombifrons]|uniref:cilia- and flagella-associated protein 107-like n=1 Tax=Spea bombifrons TaxID=233779 RepID=UPI00234BAC88|nr:cilia- and flagella-associated protein 107-like [Spea bombifrons]